MQNNMFQVYIAINEGNGSISIQQEQNFNNHHIRGMKIVIQAQKEIQRNLNMHTS
jgi:uncharacterized membrane protein YcaP (DUF421 family)